MSFTWTADPESTLIPGLDRWDQGIKELIYQVADMFTARMEAYAKANAPWNDQTGAARQGIRAWAEKAAVSVVLNLAHSVHYGIYLELGTSKMAPRPIIMPTLQAHYPEIMAFIQQALGG